MDRITCLGQIVIMCHGWPSRHLAPLFDLSMIVGSLAERFVFSRIPVVRYWLGLFSVTPQQPQGGYT